MNKPIKETKLGEWLKEKAPKALDVFGDLLPDQGTLGILKNILDNDPAIDPAEVKAKIDAEIAFQNNVTERWKADMSSDAKIAKVIRPATMIALMLFFMIVMIWDGVDPSFMPPESYISLLEILMLTVFGAYFAGRTIEKTRK
jgi:hypothetical protein